MTITTEVTQPHTLVDRAREVGREIAFFAERHDRDGTFVDEAFAALREAGLLAVGVPTELGGDGATIAEVAAIQRELARHDGSTALASSMHQHVVAFTAWRHRRDMPGAEATLRKVAEDGIVMLSTGGADFTNPRGSAVRVDGGYLVSGTKVFVSQAPIGAALSTMFPYDDPDRGRRVLNMAIPANSDGVSVLDTWDAMGMRGTGSHDVLLERVFVPAEKVLADRPHGVIDGPLQVIVEIAMPIISAVYLGIAHAAFDAAIEAAAARSTSPTVQREVGLMSHRLQIAQWGLDGALTMIGDDPLPSEAAMGAALAAKREIALAAIEVCDIAMDVAGESAFYKGSPIERSYRDVRAAKFHPLDPEATLLDTGRRLLGVAAEPT